MINASLNNAPYSSFHKKHYVIVTYNIPMRKAYFPLLNVLLVRCTVSQYFHEQDSLCDRRRYRHLSTWLTRWYTTTNHADIVSGGFSRCHYPMAVFVVVDNSVEFWWYILYLGSRGCPYSTQYELLLAPDGLYYKEYPDLVRVIDILVAFKGLLWDYQWKPALDQDFAT